MSVREYIMAMERLADEHDLWDAEVVTLVNAYDYEPAITMRADGPAVEQGEGGNDNPDGLVIRLA